MYRKTLDLDIIDKWSRLKPKDNDFILRVLEKIMNCKNSVKYHIKESSFKGYHIEIFCRVDCDICRLCYDDSRRIAYDLNRPYWARDILFEKKEKIIIAQ